MTYKIYKQQLNLSFVNEIEMPQNAQICYFAMQDGVPTIWYKFEIGAGYAVQIRRLEIFGTGYEIPDEFKKYIGTCFDGPFVWHLLEIPLQEF